jgi:hypothetical protein
MWLADNESTVIECDWDGPVERLRICVARFVREYDPKSVSVIRQVSGPGLSRTGVRYSQISSRFALDFVGQEACMVIDTTGDATERLEGALTSVLSSDMTVLWKDVSEWLQEAN